MWILNTLIPYFLEEIIALVMPGSLGWLVPSVVTALDLHADFSVKQETMSGVYLNYF